MPGLIPAWTPALEPAMSSPRLVTVTIPAPRVEKLSSRAKQRGDKPGRGWVRHVTRCDRSQKGGFAFIGPEPFLSAGERQLPVGAVVMIADYDDTAYLAVVAYDGSLVDVYDIEDPKKLWINYKTHMVTLCNRVEQLIGMSQFEILAEAVRHSEALVAEREAKFAKTRETYAREQAAVTEARAAGTPVPSISVSDFTVNADEKSLTEAQAELAEARARLDHLPEAYRPAPVEPPATFAIGDLRAERTRLLARLAEIDALLGSELAI